MILSARSFSCGIATVAVLGIGLSVVVAGPAQAAPSAPSWDDVKAAKSDAADAQQTVDELSDRLTALQDAADRAGIVEQQAGQAYALAASQQQEAKDTLADLSAQSKRAKGKADDSAGQVAALVVELSRTGGGDLSTTMLTDASDSGDLLYRVGTMSHLSERSATILAQARSDQKTVDSLADQQAVATTALSKATEATKTAFATANDVSADAQARVQKQQDQQDEVLRQLAYLKGTSVATESAYWSAQQAKAAETALAAQTSGSTSSSTNNSSGSGSGSGSTTNSNGGGGTSGTNPSTGSGTSPSTGGGTTTPSRPSTPSKPSTPVAPAPAPAPAPAKPSTPTPSKPSTPAPTTPAPAPSSPSKAAGAISYARGQLGKPYVLGGAGPNTWDCSGLTMKAYAYAGVYIGGHSVNDQYYTARNNGQLVSYGAKQAGDLIFWGSGPGSFYHVGIYIGGGQMIAAPTEGDVVKIQSVWGSPWSQVARPSA